MNEKENCLKKKRFDPFKRQFYQNGNVEIMPVVADRLVIW